MRTWTEKDKEEHSKLMIHKWFYDKMLIDAGLKPKTKLRNRHKTQIKLIFPPK